MDIPYAQVSVKTSSIPSSLKLSEELESILSQEIPSIQSFELELNSISRYNDLSKEADETKLKRASKREENRLSHTSTGSHGPPKPPKKNGATNSNEEKIHQMMDITGLSRDMSTTYLEMMNWDIESAVEMWQKNS